MEVLEDEWVETTFEDVIENNDVFKEVVFSVKKRLMSSLNSSEFDQYYIDVISTRLNIYFDVKEFAEANGYYEFLNWLNSADLRTAVYYACNFARERV